MENVFQIVNNCPRVHMVFSFCVYLSLNFPFYKDTNHTGVVHCKDSFYGQHNPQRMPVSYELENKWEAWIKAGVLCSEMETASLFTVASVLNMKAAAVLLVVWNQEKEKRGMAQETSFDVDKQIIVAIRAISNIIKGR